MTDDTSAAITAIVYSDSTVAAGVLARTATAAHTAGLTVAGLIQHDEQREGRCRCDMILECVSTGERHRLSEDRGPEARGCRLDASVLAAAMAQVAADIEEPCDLVVLNKFGKSEAEGAGLRPLIGEALARGLTIVIAVPWRNIEGWREFAGHFAREVRCEDLAAAGPRELLAAVGLSAASIASAGMQSRSNRFRQRA